MLKFKQNGARWLTVGTILAAAGLARADFNPIPLTPGSFTADVVIEKTAPPPFPTYVNVTMDGGTNNNGNTWYEQGYNPSLPNTGLPRSGATFAPTQNPEHLFQMPPDYTTNNCLYVGGANAPGTSTFVTHVPTGTLNFKTPAAFATLSILFAAGGNPSNVVNYVVHHADSTTETGSFGTPDWFNNTEGNVALVAGGRVNMDNGNLNTLNSTTSTKVFFFDIPLVNTTSPVTGIDFGLDSAVGRTMIFGVSGSTGADFTPVTVTGFNKDVVVEATALRVGCLLGYTTVTMDNGINNFGNTFYEKGLRPGDTSSGLPTHGSTFTNAAANHVFTMPATYAGNNCLFIANQTGFTTGSLTITTPTVCTALSLLSGAGSGPLVMAYTVHFADASTQAGSVSVTDWFNAATPAYFPNGRFQVETLAFNNVGTTTGSHIYNVDLALTGTSPVTSIDFTYTSGGRAPIFAISGQTTSGGNFYPLGISGYNADIVVEATAFPNPPNATPFPLTTVTSVSMDGGTANTGNTWFEQGWYPNMPTAGLPAAGSTITSAAQPNNRYQMPASYTDNNAIFVDSSHTNANLTLITPSAYSALSFLSATANGNVTNRVIIQFQDGTAETNQFVSVDWFNNSPYAFIANGRGNLGNRSVNNDPGHAGAPRNPRLYEAQFFLSNYSSPVTNLVLQFVGAANANGRMVVLAVSGAVGAVAPIMNSPALASVTTYEGSNITFSVGSVQGTLPITNQWQISKNGGASFENLTDGGNIAGSKTPTLVITSVSITNAGQYKFVSSNPVGSVSSGTANLTVISGLPEITKPGDPITIYPETSTAPAAESVDHAIDNLVGANPGKYLNNSGAGSGFVVTPSQGSTIVKAMRFYTANDAQERDPASFTLEGSNDGGSTWTPVTSGSLALPATRNSAASATENPLTQTMTEVDFYSNTAGYLAYRVIFPTLYTPGTALMQIGEVDLLGVTNPVTPIIIRQPAAVTVWVGGSPTFSVGALGTPPLAYQWYRNGNPIPGATNATYVTNNVQLSDSGSSFRCTVSNPFGPTTSSSATLNVISGAPTKPYPMAVLADHPVAFWRLDEAANATAAYDYVGGHNGVYNAALNEQPGYNPVQDTDTATAFGSGVSQDSYVGNITDLDFASPTNIPATFSVEAWVFGTASQVAGAGIIAAGYGGGGEQFAIDVGANNVPTNGLRFYFRDASANAHGVGSVTVAYDSKWHHVVGVLDEVNNSQVLYIDGIPAASATLPAGLGVRSFTSPINIGSRQAANGGARTLQFVGTIDDVALYNTALSSNQVLAHYYAAQLPPVFSLSPTNLTAAEHGTATVKSVAYGPPAISYQWYESTDYGANFSPMATRTNANLTLSNVTLSLDQRQYFVVATNPYGSTTSSPPAILSVVSGPPVFSLDLAPVTLVYAGSTAALAVAVDGSAPFYYQWTSNGVNLSDSGRLSGSRSNVLTILNTLASDSAVYRVSVSNAQSASVGGPLLSTPTSLYVESVPDFNTNGLGWSINGGATFADNTATMTDNQASEARSIWYNFPLYIGNFYASWVYRDVLAGGADGATFCLHNDPRGTAALGGAGGSLGVSGIIPSAELEFNIYASGTPGIAFHVNGATGGYTTPSPVAIDNGNPIYVTVRYNGSIAHLTLADSNTLSYFSADLPVGDLRAVLGADTAYVGFTAATGGTASQQTISNFSFIPFPALSAQATGPNSLLLSWPTSIGGYVLQSKADINSANWQAVTAPITQVNGQNQVTVSTTGGASFYRLVMSNTGAQ